MGSGSKLELMDAFSQEALLNPFEQMNDILLVKLLHGSSMLAGMPILVSAL